MPILENYLVSLRSWQTVLPDESWLAVEPQGPDDPTVELARELCEPYGVQVIRVEPRPQDPYWNKCRANNHAIRRSGTDIDYVMQIDVDMILHPRHIETALTVLQSHPEALYLCPNRSLKDPVVLSETGGLAQWAALLEKSVYVPTGAELPMKRMSNPSGVGPPSKSSGVVQCAKRCWWHSIRGYDERICGWGSDDADILRRASMQGKPRLWAAESYLALHQVHPRSTEGVTAEERELRKARRLLNREMSFNACRAEKITRNRKGWGGVLEDPTDRT